MFKAYFSSSHVNRELYVMTKKTSFLYIPPIFCLNMQYSQNSDEIEELYEIIKKILSFLFVFLFSLNVQAYQSSAERNLISQTTQKNLTQEELFNKVKNGKFLGYIDENLYLVFCKGLINASVGVGPHIDGLSYFMKFEHNINYYRLKPVV